MHYTFAAHACVNKVMYFCHCCIDSHMSSGFHLHSIVGNEVSKLGEDRHSAGILTLLPGSDL